MRRKLTAALLLGALAACAGRARAQQTVSVSEKTRQRLSRATVYIQTELFMANRDWSDLPPEVAERIAHRPKEMASGTGFLVSSDGYIVTNAHVVDGLTLLVRFNGQQIAVEQAPPDTPRMKIDLTNIGQPFTLTLSPGTIHVITRSGEKEERKRFPKVLRVDRGADLALLKIDAGEPLDHLEFDDGGDLRSGVPVLMAGFPGGALPDIAPFANSSNIDSLKDRAPKVSLNAGMVTAVREYKGERRYQLDIRANHGNSGGPITTPEGKVVGVLYAGLDTMQSINYAIPVSYVRKILPSSLASGEPAEEKPAADNSYEEFKKSSSFSMKKKK